MIPRLEWKQGAGAYAAVPIGATAQAEISLFGNAKSPTTNNSANTGPTATITPPASMVAGQSVVVVAMYRGTTETLTVGDNGGQSWTSETQINSGNTRLRIFRCVFDGTWDANPTFTVTSGTNAILAWMTVWDNVDQSTQLDVAVSGAGYSAPSTPFTVTRTGVNTSTDGAVVVAILTAEDNNTWGTYTGGYTNVDGAWRVTTTTGLSMNIGYKTIASAGASGDYGANQATLGGDAGVTVIFALKREAATNNEVFIATSGNITGGGEATTGQLTAPGTGHSFVAGRMWDDENGSDTLTPAIGQYTEVEWCIQFGAAASGTYDFRVTDGGSALAAYGVTPSIVVSTGLIETIGQVTEADTLQTLARFKTKSVAAPTETDLAQTLVVGGSPIVVAIGQAIESDTLQTLGRAKLKATTQTTESDTAQAQGRAKAKAISAAVETDVAQELNNLKSLTVVSVTETDLAQTLQVGGGPKIVTIGQALESDSGQTFDSLKLRALTQATSTHTSQAFGKLKLHGMLGSEEVDLAQVFAAEGGYTPPPPTGGGHTNRRRWIGLRPPWMRNVEG